MLTEDIENSPIANSFRNISSAAKDSSLFFLNSPVEDLRATSGLRFGDFAVGFGCGFMLYSSVFRLNLTKTCLFLIATRTKNPNPIRPLTMMKIHSRTTLWKMMLNMRINQGSPSTGVSINPVINALFTLLTILLSLLEDLMWIIRIIAIIRSRVLMVRMSRIGPMKVQMTPPSGVRKQWRLSFT